jgi:hypothetical protein
MAKREPLTAADGALAPRFHTPPPRGTFDQGTTMSSVLIGVFDNSSQARAAIARIAATGIGPLAMSLSGGDGTAAVPRADARSTATAIPAAISRFFADLLGTKVAAATDTEAVQRGHVVLTVTATDDEHADEVSEIMRNCGAFDIDEHAEHWYAGGYAAQRSRFGDEDAGPTGEERYAGAERRFNGGAGYVGRERRVGL